LREMIAPAVGIVIWRKLSVSESVSAQTHMPGIGLSLRFACCGKGVKHTVAQGDDILVLARRQGESQRADTRGYLAVVNLCGILASIKLGGETNCSQSCGGLGQRGV
jgi:hypothetical protein